MLLEDVLQEYLYDCQLRKLSLRTIKTARNSNQRLFGYLANVYSIVELEDVKRLHIQSFITHMSEQGLKESYINTLLKCFRGLFAYCKEEGYLLNSPTDKVKFQKEELPVITTFTNEEVKKMVDFYSGKTFLEQRNKLILTFLLDSGIRNSELCDIHVEDIHETSVKIRGKGKKVRYVPLTLQSIRLY